jgi:outer membrane protein TolC
MIDNSGQPGSPSDEVRTSSVLQLLRGMLQNRRALCILGGTALVAAYASINVRPDAIALAAQSEAAGTSPSSEMLIIPRGAGTTQGVIPSWRSPAASSIPLSERQPANNQPNTINPPTRATLGRPIIPQNSATNLQRSAELQDRINNGTAAEILIRASGNGVLKRPQFAQQIDSPSIPYEPEGAVPDIPPPYRPETQPPASQSSSVVIPPQLYTPQSNIDYSGQQNYSSSQGSGYAPGTSGFRATVECDAPPWMESYYGRTGQIPRGLESSPTPAPSVVLPNDFVAWWDPLVRESAGLAPNTVPVEVATLVQQALAHAPQVQVLQADPEVQYTIVSQEEAAFDWRAFLDAKYSDLNDPIGNTLTTGNNDNRFNDNKVNSQGGFKRRTQAGGELQIAQSIGHQYNNSRFLLPNPQSTSRLELSFRQPILSHAGTVYNQNQIILAGISSNITSDESLQDLQTHLFDVTESYWSLYRARAEFFQRQKLLASSQHVLQTLEGRNQVDTIPRQILRARAAVARAESRMQRAVTDIRNAESRLRLLVNDPAMLNSGPLEFTPSESPTAIASQTGLRETLETALVNRPDISRAIREMRASSVRIGVSKNELLPRLDVLVTSYVAGLQDRTQIGDSLGNQFTDGRPGYTIGLEFEVPLGNRAAKAKLEQRQWELKRAISAFRVTVETSLTEVEIASRETDTSYREMLGKYQAMIAAQNEVAYLQDRFSVLPRVEDSTMLLLEDLLDGYERLADEESAFVQSQTAYALSIIQLRRATGTLMRSRHDAPQIDADESEWMSARAEQTAEETEARASRTVSFRVAETLDEQGRPPAAWSEPLPARTERPALVTERPEPSDARRSAVRPVSTGGHSFGN